MKVDFIFDVASPNMYFCHKLIPDFETRTGVEFEYIPCLLGAEDFSKVRSELDGPPLTLLVIGVDIVYIFLYVVLPSSFTACRIFPRFPAVL